MLLFGHRALRRFNRPDRGAGYSACPHGKVSDIDLKRRHPAVDDQLAPCDVGCVL